MKMILSSVALIALLLVAPALTASGPAEGVETFIANVVAFSSAQGAATDTLTLRVERWTNPEEKRVLLNLLGEKGMKAFEKALDELDLGRLSATATIGLPIGLATSEKTSEGRTIRLLLQRPLLHRELSKMERSADYPFIVVEFTMDAKGGGTGRVVPAAKLRVDRKGELEIIPFSEPNEQRIIAVKKLDQ